MAGTYPVVAGKILAPKCEVNVAEHCNLACRGCSHASPALPKRFVDPAVLFRDLSVLGRHYHVDWVRLLGGEPLLHPDLLGIVEVVRRAGVAERICVVTNGVLLPRMSPEFWRAVDRVNVSLYPGRELSAEKQALCVERATASGTTLQFKKYHEFRESYSETGTSDPLLVRAIFDSCEIVHRWRCHTVADGRFYKCPQSYMLPKLVEGCHGNESVDSIAIDDSETFGHDLLWFLQSPEPLATCANCLGSAGRRFEHQQVRRREFRVLQQAPTEELIDPALLAPLS